MLQEKPTINVEELLAKANKPSADAMKLHPFYRGKIETTLKCTVRSFDDFAIWYTPGVAAPCRAIAGDPEMVYEYTNKWNTVAVVSDGTRVSWGWAISAPRPACRSWKAKRCSINTWAGWMASRSCWIPKIRMRSSTPC